MIQERAEASEERLVQAALQGDRSAFTTLVLRYRDVAFAYAFATLRNREEAEDAAQEAFLRAFQSMNRFRNGSTWGTWMMSILRNHCIDLLRRKSKRVETPLQETHPCAFPTPEFQLMNTIQREELQKAIAALPDKFRIPLMMHYASGSTYREIALALAIPETTVTGRIARALHLLRRRMHRE